MTRRRRAAAGEEEEEDDGLQRESEYVERASQPMKQHEVTSKAFFVLWVDFFKTFAGLAAAVAAYAAFSSALGAGAVSEQVAFLLLTALTFYQSRVWLGEVNVVRDVSGDGSLVRHKSFVRLSGCVLGVVCFPLATGNLRDFFPTALVFYLFALASVVYMRHSARQTEVFLKSL